MRKKKHEPRYFSVFQYVGANETGVIPAGKFMPFHFQQKLESLARHVEWRLVQENAGTIENPNISAVRFVDIHLSYQFVRGMMLGNHIPSIFFQASQNRLNLIIGEMLQDLAKKTNISIRQWILNDVQVTELYFGRRKMPGV